MSLFYYKIIHSDVKRCEQGAEVKATFGCLLDGRSYCFQRLDRILWPQEVSIVKKVILGISNDEK